MQHESRITQICSPGDDGLCQLMKDESHFVMFLTPDELHLCMDMKLSQIANGLYDQKGFSDYFGMDLEFCF